MGITGNIKKGLAFSMSILLKPKMTFEKVFDDKNYGHLFFLVFYGLANNIIGYLHSPEKFVEHAHADIWSGSMSVGIAAFHAVIEVLAYSIAIFLVVKITRRSIGYHRILKTLTYSLSPLLYIGAVWGLIAGDRLRYWEAGTSPWTLWSIPYTIAHGFFLYLIVLGFFMMYRHSYPDFGKGVFEFVFGPLKNKS